MSRDVVYLDHQATTPVDQRVLDAMLPFLAHNHANPSSPHQLGRLAAEALRAARGQIQASLSARHDTEIVFTSGATEANHLAIVGAATGSRRFYADHIITTAIEHKSVLAACDQLAAAGYSFTTVPVDRAGRVDPADIADAITPRTVLVSVMYANNEVGTVQPIADIAAVTRHRGVLLHVCRPTHHLRPQDLRSKGNRRPLHPPRHAPASPIHGQPGTRHAGGHR